jgi:hypothetical protein
LCGVNYLRHESSEGRPGLDSRDRAFIEIHPDPVKDDLTKGSPLFWGCVNPNVTDLRELGHRLVQVLRLVQVESLDFGGQFGTFSVVAAAPDVSIEVEFLEALQSFRQTFGVP